MGGLIPSIAFLSEWSKEPDLRPGGVAAWVRTPQNAFYFYNYLL